MSCAKQRLKIILPVVFFVIFLLLNMVFHSVTEANAPAAMMLMSSPNPNL